MQTLFKTLNETYGMNIKHLTEAYEKSLEEQQQKLLKGVAEFFGAKSIKFDGGEEYNDEEYYNDLIDLYIDGESVQNSFQLSAKVYEKLFGEKSPHKEDGKYGPDIWEQWRDIKDELINQLPEFIKTKTTSYDA